MDSLHPVPPPAARRPPLAGLSALSRAELEALLIELFGEVAALKQLAGEQREEIARLKGLKGRPTIRPSGMDQGTESAKSGKRETRRGRGKVTPRVSIDEKVFEARVPPGSRFKGYEPFLVQDLVISVRRPVISASAGSRPTDGRSWLRYPRGPRDILVPNCAASC